MKSLGSLVIVVVLLAAASAFAGGLTERDYDYLKTHWGLERNGDVAKFMTDQDQAQLHGLINDPAYRGNSQAIENHVGDYLFKIESCYNWVEIHPNSQPCPLAANVGVTPGKIVADRSCNMCHLVGSSITPSFFKLSRQGGWTEDRLAAAVKAGHQMSPITLSASELHDLAAYIASLK